MNFFNTIILGGGAAGFFAAANISKGPTLLLERSLQVLSKVRISGGGRCNVTHSCFDPRQLAAHYPRGFSELIGVFSRFQPLDTIAWFKERGVELKVEADGRMFPITDSSETIIQCLTRALRTAGVELKTKAAVEEIYKEGGQFIVKAEDCVYTCNQVILATGSHPKGHRYAEALGHSIQPLVPSLFTFNVPSSPLLDLSGVTVPLVEISLPGTALKERGPLLLTHFGFSGPAILKTSAWGATELFSRDYKTEFCIDWTAGMKKEHLRGLILSEKRRAPSALFSLDEFANLPKALSKRLFEPVKRYAELSNKDIEEILEILTTSRYRLEGKTTNKSEFVTCGGITRKEVDFKTMQSKICKGLYFAGEILDIDGITGGFNFQNAWSTSYLAAKAIDNL